MLIATLTYLKRGRALTKAESLARLHDDDADFLARHVMKLREASSEEKALFSRFQHASAITVLFSRLLTAPPEEFVEISAGLATRLQASMDQSQRADPGILAVIASGPDETAEVVSVLKLDAITEAARYELEGGEVQLSVLRDLLPAPGNLQKGISWTDSRTASDAIVIDRNQTAARYFFNAFELQVSPTPTESEKVLAQAIIRDVPRAQRAEAMAFAGTLSGPGEVVAAQVKERYPAVQVDVPALGAGGLPGGNIRPGKVATHQTRYRGDGISVTVPHDRLDRITGPRPVAGGWELIIRFSVEPQEEPT